MKKKLYRLFQWVVKGVPVVKVTPQVSQLADGEKLKGKRIMMIGGSKGVGLEIAKKCVDCGAEILIVGRNEETLVKASKQLENCRYIVFDILQTEKLSALIDEAASTFNGPIDCLIDNAALYLHEKNMMEVTPEGFDRQFATNVKAPFFLAQAFISYLKKNNVKNANILFVSSERGLYCDDVPYGLSKAALNSLTEGLARRYVKEGIRVNALAPGTMAYEAAVADDLYNKYSCGQRYVMPEEVGEVAAFLLSDAASVLNGMIVPCNFGNHLRCDW